MLQPEVAPDDTTVPGVAAEPALAPTAKVDHVNAVGAVRVTDAAVTEANAGALSTSVPACAITEIRFVPAVDKVKPVTLQ
jgi:hypothetical protein